MSNLRVLRCEDAAQWSDLMSRVPQHDFYHTAEYSALAEQMGEGYAHLFVYTEGSFVIALPLLLRAIDAVPGLNGTAEGLWDATSVYGYAGPMLSHAKAPASVIGNFHVALYDALRDRGVVSVFSRLHPLISQSMLISGLGERVCIGETVSIDLTLSAAAQRSLYRSNHRRDIAKLMRLGVVGLNDRSKGGLDEFISLYHETMYRVDAEKEFFFSPFYFDRLTTGLGSKMQLFSCRLGEHMICSGLFSLCNNIVQYHLGATKTEYLKLAPMKVLFDTVRSWANEKGAHVLHLGGGVGARADSLFHFKAGFSDRRHEFATWQWVLLPDIYKRLCDKRDRWLIQRGAQPAIGQYFPAYRIPIPSEPPRTNLEPVRGQVRL